MSQLWDRGADAWCRGWAIQGASKPLPNQGCPTPEEEGELEHWIAPGDRWGFVVGSPCRGSDLNLECLDADQFDGEHLYTPHVHAEHLQSDAKRVHGQTAQSSRHPARGGCSIMIG